LAGGLSIRPESTQERIVSHLKGVVSRAATEGGERGVQHTVREKQKLLNRVKRIRGQVAAVEDLLETDVDCERALHTLAACRGAINSLMAEILEDHIRYHVIAPEAPQDSHERLAAEQLVDIVKSYFK
jgi:DNA-binding FrmR family transcriptional regulator